MGNLKIKIIFAMPEISCMGFIFLLCIAHANEYEFLRKKYSFHAHKKEIGSLFLIFILHTV